MTEFAAKYSNAPSHCITCSLIMGTFVCAAVQLAMSCSCSRSNRIRGS